MKLKDWADKQGISYITAWRWFNAGDPRLSDAYQSDSGTIIVPDEQEYSEQVMASSNTHNDAMSVFLKKTVEFSKNNSTVEDFAAYVISNFSLKLNSSSDGPKYSRQKPKSEEVQKHFQKFLPDREKEEHLKAVKSLIKERASNPLTPEEEAVEEELTRAFLLSEDMKEETAENLVNTSVDLNTTPQQINYTDSTNQVLSSSIDSIRLNSGDFSATSSSFQPTRRELASAASLNTIADDIAEADVLPRRRGRKSYKVLEVK